jgi:hypothetical protein
MEFLTVTNIVTAVIVVVMLLALIAIFTADVGDNRLASIMLFVLLGIALYLWRSGTALNLLKTIGAITE